MWVLWFVEFLSLSRRLWSQDAEFHLPAVCVYAARWQRGGAIVSHTQRFLIRQWTFLTCHLAGLLCVPSEVLPALALRGAAWGFAESRAEAELWLAAWPEPWGRAVRVGTVWHFWWSISRKAFADSRWIPSSSRLSPLWVGDTLGLAAMLSCAVIGLCTISSLISFLRLILFILQHIEIPHSFWFLFFIQFSSVAQLCPTLCNPMDCSTPGLPVHRQLPEFTQTHVHWVGDAIQPSHPLSSPSLPAFNLSQHQGLFKWVSSSHQVAKVLEFQLRHQSFQWIFRTDFF